MDVLIAQRLAGRADQNDGGDVRKEFPPALLQRLAIGRNRLVVLAVARIDLAELFQRRGVIGRNSAGGCGYQVRRRRV